MIQYWTQIFLDSVQNSRDSRWHSLPMPDIFIPPNGIRKSRTIQQLHQIVPAFTRTKKIEQKIRTLSKPPRILTNVITVVQDNVPRTVLLGSPTRSPLLPQQSNALTENPSHIKLVWLLFDRIRPSRFCGNQVDNLKSTKRLPQRLVKVL